MIFINNRFPKTKRSYEKAADDNTDLLIERMKSIVVAEQSKQTSILRQPKQEGAGAWSYQEQKKKKPKTFRLT
jgi:hypothetical protein